MNLWLAVFLIIIFLSAVVITVATNTVPTMATNNVSKNISIIDSCQDEYCTYTKAFNCTIDYEIECKDKNLISQTPIGRPRVASVDKDFKWCNPTDT